MADPLMASIEPQPMGRSGYIVYIHYRFGHTLAEVPDYDYASRIYWNMLEANVSNAWEMQVIHLATINEMQRERGYQ